MLVGGHDVEHKLRPCRRREQAPHGPGARAVIGSMSLASRPDSSRRRVHAAMMSQIVFSMLSMPPREQGVHILESEFACSRSPSPSNTAT